MRGRRGQPARFVRGAMAATLLLPGFAAGVGKTAAAARFDERGLPFVFPSPGPDDPPRFWLGMGRFWSWDRQSITLSDATRWERQTPVRTQPMPSIGMRVTPSVSVETLLLTSATVQLDVYERSRAKLAFVGHAAFWPRRLGAGAFGAAQLVRRSAPPLRLWRFAGTPGEVVAFAGIYAHRVWKVFSTDQGGFDRPAAYNDAIVREDLATGAVGIDAAAWIFALRVTAGVTQPLGSAVVRQYRTTAFEHDRGAFAAVDVGLRFDLRD